MRSKRPARPREVLAKAWETRRAKYGDNGMERKSQTRNPAYMSWVAAKQRCRSEAHENYKYYGARGIQFDKRWDKFEVFLKDMGPRPPKHTLDRIDVNGNYEPGNCRWATQKEQVRNTRVSIRLTFGDRTQSLPDWADEVGIEPGTLWYRINAGWAVERALTEPVRRRA